MSRFIRTPRNTKLTPAGGAEQTGVSRLADGMDLFIIEAAGCAPEPGGQRFRDCSQTPEVGGGIVRCRNKRDLPLLYCALGVPRISRRGRGL